MSNDYAPPQPVQFRGSVMAQTVLRWMGWRLDFQGLPALQGVIVVYPHTSNWDLPVGMLLKWAMGLQAKFWAKDSLFRIPLFGPWLRWLGGVSVDRQAARGVVPQMVDLIVQKKLSRDYFWLVLAPEGTRSLRPGWRSGFYRVALGADVPVALAALDYGQKKLTLTQFVRLTGDQSQDMQRIALAFVSSRGYRPALASPVRLDVDKEKA